MKLILKTDKTEGFLIEKNNIKVLNNYWNKYKKWKKIKILLLNH